MNSPHIVFHGQDVLCTHCGGREQVFPKSVTMVTAMVQAFETDHRRCKLSDKSPASRPIQSPQAWLNGWDTGTSSITICRVMSGLGDRTRVGWPLDPDVFGRCHRLLNLFPEWRERMGEVAAAYPLTPWVAYAREWNRMTALYEEELPSGRAPKLYALMQQLRTESGAA